MEKTEIMDIASKLMAITSTALYYLGYIDAGTLIGIVGAVVAVMASLLLHRYKEKVKHAIKMAGKPKVIVLKTLKGETVTVVPKCRVCSHEKREEIERMIAEGRRISEIWREAGELTPDELAEHVKHKLLEGEELERIQQTYRIRKIDMQEEMLKLLERLNQLYEKLEKLDQRYQEGKLTPTAYISSIGERRQIINKIKQTLTTINKLKTEIKTEKQLSELLQRLHSR